MTNCNIERADIINIDEINNIESDCDVDRYSIKLIEESLKNKNMENYIIRDDNNVGVGYVSFSIVCDECELVKIVVSKKYRKCGYAFALMRYMLYICATSDINTIFLEVRKSNVPAIKLYEKCGFEKINIRENYYNDGEDALIYRYTF